MIYKPIGLKVYEYVTALQGIMTILQICHNLKTPVIKLIPHSTIKDYELCSTTSEKGVCSKRGLVSVETLKRSDPHTNTKQPMGKTITCKWRNQTNS